MDDNDKKGIGEGRTDSSAAIITPIKVEESDSPDIILLLRNSCNSAVASPASSNTAQLWTEKYRQSLGYFVRNDQMTALLIAGSTRIVTNTRDNINTYLTDECLLVLRDCPNRGNNRRYERRMNKLGNEYDDYSEDDCKEREMFPAQSGRPRKWHDLREGIFLIPNDRVCSRTAEYSQLQNKIWNTLVNLELTHNGDPTL
uniref:Uncharacterized protein n=1 Tax=Rhizophagus irregularis (strain DAOM 181602 / DAOM 197198 / MUCL 43194) TaxID=747089 RepID=U9TIJ4_RHIID